MEGLGRFIEADNHSAVDVSDLRRGTRSQEVQQPQSSEAFPKATIKERAVELTLRADEVGTQRPSSTQSILSLSGGDRRWLMRTGMPSAKQSTKEFKGKNGESCIVAMEK